MLLPPPPPPLSRPRNWARDHPGIDSAPSSDQFQSAQFSCRSRGVHLPGRQEVAMTEARDAASCCRYESHPERLYGCFPHHLQPKARMFGPFGVAGGLVGVAKTPRSIAQKACEAATNKQPRRGWTELVRDSASVMGRCPHRNFWIVFQSSAARALARSSCLCK